MHTFADPIKFAAQIAANKIAVVDGEQTFTFRELHRRCRALAGALSHLGINKGDRVAILAANSHQYIETYVGVPAAGFVVVPLNTRHAEPELEYALRDSAAPAGTSPAARARTRSSRRRRRSRSAACPPLPRQNRFPVIEGFCL